MGWLQDILDRLSSDEPREPYYIIRKEHLGLLVDIYFSQMLDFSEDAPGHKAQNLKAAFLRSAARMGFEGVAGFNGTWRQVQFNLKTVAVLGKRAGLSLAQASDWAAACVSDNPGTKKAELCKNKDIKITKDELYYIAELVEREGWLRGQCNSRIEEIDATLASSGNSKDFIRKIKREKSLLTYYKKHLSRDYSSLSEEVIVSALRQFSKAVHDDVYEGRVELITPNPRIGRGKGGESLPDRW